MKKKILLIEGSIKKWQDIIDGTGIDNGINNCPLCQEYYDENCYGCPVEEYTGRTCCEDTPYWDWEEYCNEHTDWPYKVFDDYSKELATYERDFLIKILENYEEHHEM